MLRTKIIYGDELSADCIQNQGTEAFLRCQILNRMNHMGNRTLTGWK